MITTMMINGGIIRRIKAIVVASSAMSVVIDVVIGVRLRSGVYATAERERGKETLRFH